MLDKQDYIFNQTMQNYIIYTLFHDSYLHTPSECH